MYTHETVNLLQRLYEWSCVDATDIDEERYLLSKKLSEVVHIRCLTGCRLLIHSLDDLPHRQITRRATQSNPY